MEIVQSFFDSFGIDCMAIGGLFAIYLHSNSKILRLFYSKNFQVIVITTLAILIAKGVYIQYLNYEAYAILFGIIILNLASNNETVLNLEYKPLHYLDKISYGLYMYHPLAIWITIKTIDSVGFEGIFI